MTASQQLSYIACDVPEGMRLDSWRAALAALDSRPRRHHVALS